MQCSLDWLLKHTKHVDSICIFNEACRDESFAWWCLPPCYTLLSEPQPISAVAFDTMHFKDEFKTQMLSLELQCGVDLL